MSDKIEPGFPRPWLDKCYLQGRDFLFAVKRIAALHGLSPANDLDQIALGLAAQGIYPAWTLELNNKGRKRKLDPGKYVLTSREVVSWLDWYEKALTAGREAAA